MKKILITGARGFVGRNLKEALADKYEIFAPTHKELELLDYEALARYVEQNQIQSVVHAAVHVPQFNGAEKEYFNDMQMLSLIHIWIKKILGPKWSCGLLYLTFCKNRVPQKVDQVISELEEKREEIGI